MDWQSKFRTKKLRKEFEKESKEEVEYFLKIKMGKVEKIEERIRKKLKRKWKKS